MSDNSKRVPAHTDLDPGRSVGGRVRLQKSPLWLLLRRRKIRKFWERLASDGIIKIVIPTINSASYIDIILSYYRAIGLPVTVFVDNKTTDETAKVAARYTQEVILFDNPASRVGEMIEGMSNHCKTRWILRIDDDELPSWRMIELVRQIVSSRESHIVGFNRYQVVFNRRGEPFRSLKHDPDTHRQWRLYQPATVAFHGRGHTPGFDLEEEQMLSAPPDSFMIHLDWVVHSRDERLQKLLRYDRHTPGHGMAFRSYYLADESPDFRDDLRPLPAPEFHRIGKLFADRFAGSTI